MLVHVSERFKKFGQGAGARTAAGRQSRAPRAWRSSASSSSLRPFPRADRAAVGGCRGPRFSCFSSSSPPPCVSAKVRSISPQPHPCKSGGWRGDHGIPARGQRFRETQSLAALLRAAERGGIRTGDAEVPRPGPGGGWSQDRGWGADWGSSTCPGDNSVPAKLRSGKRGEKTIGQTDVIVEFSGEG